MAEPTRRAVVVHDVINTRVQTRDYPAEFEYGRAFREQQVDLVQSEFDRLLALGAIAPADEPEEVRAALADADAVGTPYEQGQAGDDYLAGLSAPDLIAYVTQNPSEAQRVYRIEAATKKRVTVLKATGLDENGEPIGDAHTPVLGAAGGAGQGGSLQGAAVNPDGSPADQPVVTGTTPQG